MKTRLSVFGLLALGLMGQTLDAQTGWIQTQLNGGTGYNIYSSGVEIYAATGNGTYSTADSGMPWFAKGPAGHAVYDVIKSHQYLLAATSDGVFRSSDNGNTWLSTSGSPSFSGTGQTLGPRLFAKNSSYVFATTWVHGVFRSGDDGNSWQQVRVGTREGYYGDIGGFSNCICTAGEKVIVSVEVGHPTIYISGDNGLNWESRSINAQMAGDLIFLSYNDGKLFAGGFTGLYLSTDLGYNWAPLYSNTVSPEGKLVGLGIIRDVVSYNQSLIAAVDFTGIQISRDNGKSWSSFNSGLISDWTFASLAIKSPYIWAIRGFFGNAYRRSLAELLTEVGKGPSTLPNNYSLDQNYPNPFNPRTAISFQLSAISVVSLRVYDVMGREVATLVDGTRAAGFHTAYWDASSMPSGAYIYRLRVADISDNSTKRYTDARKMVLLR
jgi:hypothetical protein